MESQSVAGRFVLFLTCPAFLCLSLDVANTAQFCGHSVAKNRMLNIANNYVPH